MSSELRLEHIRGVLIRLEETIIFGLIERAQFRLNPIIYVKNGLGEALGGESLVGFLLHECEKSHAKVRRYTSPDEHPFFNDLPSPILPPLKYDNPLHPNKININAKIRTAYEEEIVPFFCIPGDDRQYGSSAVNDVMLLQALSKRIHYGKFVAESKYRQSPFRFDPLIRVQDRSGLWDAITDREVEERLYDRVRRKAATYGQELIAAGETAVDPDKVVMIYKQWIVPMSKEVEVLYLVARLD